MSVDQAWLTKRVQWDPPWQKDDDGADAAPSLVELLKALPASSIDPGQLSAAFCAQLSKLMRMRQAYPLAFLVPWERGPQREGDERYHRFNDQRTAILACLDPDSVAVCIFGGNRSGKTFGGIMAGVILALGREHPAVMLWCAMNDVDPQLIPSGPGRVCFVAPKSADSVRVHRPMIDKMTGGRKSWYNLHGKGEARVFVRAEDVRDEGWTAEDLPGAMPLEARVAVLGSARPAALGSKPQQAEFWFKSADQGRAAMQADSFRAVVIDEELLNDAEGIFNELRMRVADQNGIIIYPMTPLSGRRWTYRRFIQGALAEGEHVFRLRSTDNPNLPKGFERAYDGMSDATVSARRDGEFVALQGAIYPMWNDTLGERHGHTHRCAPFDIPDDWTRFRANDFGTANPDCTIWAAWDEESCTLYVYDVMYETGRDTQWLSEEVQRREASAGEVEYAWIDPSARRAWLDYHQLSGGAVVYAKADNNVDEGIRCVSWFLRSGGQGTRLKVFDLPQCEHLHDEASGYVYEDVEPGVPRAEKPVKKDDHAMDALRYLCMGVAGHYSWEVG